MPGLSRPGLVTGTASLLQLLLAGHGGRPDSGTDLQVFPLDGSNYRGGRG